MRILYVEDEKVLADAVIHLLKKEGIDVDWTGDGEEGLTLAKKDIYDAIVLDVMLPKLSGFDILRTIRGLDVRTPVIMLSALAEVEDKIRGLNLGADDYLAKPFKATELVARLNAITRRPPLADPSIMRYSDLNYDPAERTLNGVVLTSKEAKVLEALMNAPGRTITKEYLLTHIWGADTSLEENYVEVYISYVRKKLKLLNSKVTIKTIRSLGYKLYDPTASKA